MTKSLFCMAALMGCTNAASTGITADNLSCPTDSTRTYASFGSDLISTHCLSCHASKEHPSLATQAQVRASSAQILQEAVYTTAMPQDGDLTIEDRRAQSARPRSPAARTAHRRAARAAGAARG